MRKVFLVLAIGVFLGMATGCGGGNVTPSPTPFSNVPQGGITPASPLPTEVAPPPSQATCRVTPPVGQPLPNLPPVTGDDWVRGPVDAPVTLITYSDFQ